MAIGDADGARHRWFTDWQCHHARTWRALEGQLRDDADAEAGGDHAQHRLHLTAFQGDTRLEAHGATAIERRRAQMIADTIEDEWLGGGHAQRDRLPLG